MRGSGRERAANSSTSPQMLSQADQLTMAPAAAAAPAPLKVCNLFGVAGKVVLVTGGGTGIGRMIAQGFVDNGARVYIASRKEASKAAADIMRASPHPSAFCQGLTADLAYEVEQQRLLDAIAKAEPSKGLHVLVNNSGTNWAEAMETYPLQAFDKVMGLNVKAIFSLTRLAVPLLEAAATHDDPARVLNIGSIDGKRVGLVDHFAYSASKAAVHRLTKVMAGKLGDRRITVNAIAPGPFESKMMAVTLDRARNEIVEGTVLGRIGREADMAGVSLFLASNAGAYVTGAVIVVDGGILVKPRL